MTVSLMRPPVAPLTLIGKCGQLLHLLPPLTVKSTISDVVCNPSEFPPVVTRILETVIQEEEKIIKFSGCTLQRKVIHTV